MRRGIPTENGRYSHGSYLRVGNQIYGECEGDKLTLPPGLRVRIMSEIRKHDKIYYTGLVSGWAPFVDLPDDDPIPVKDLIE